MNKALTDADREQLRKIYAALIRCAEAIAQLVGDQPKGVKKKQLAVAKQFTTQDLKDAEYLWQLIATNYPFMKPPKDMELWADEIRKLRTLDGKPAGCFTHIIIVGVIEWCQNDSFWRKNIRSAGKLRTQFETLLAAALAEQESRKKQSMV